MDLLQKILLEILTSTGLWIFALIIMGLLLFMKERKKRVSVFLIVLVLVVSPSSLNSMEKERRIATEISDFGKGIIEKVKEEDYILFGKKVDKATMAKLVEEKLAKDDIANQVDQESREIETKRIENALKVYKLHHNRVNFEKKFYSKKLFSGMGEEDKSIKDKGVK